MSPNESPCLVLDVETEVASRKVRLRLSDASGGHLGFQEVALAEHPAGAWEGAFDTRGFVHRMESEVRAATGLLTDVGVFLGTGVLGGEIFGALEKGGRRSRTLMVKLPDAGSDPLAAAFARVPWEIARRAADAPSLGEQNVVVRAIATGTEVASGVDNIAPSDRPVRVLLVFAEAPGSRPLAMRLERERLLDLFFEEVLPGRQVEVDVLCHGVTRSRLSERVMARGGFDIVHWSGHGHVDALEIDLDPGEKAAKQVTGRELVDLCSAGGFIPELVFLSACHSGGLVQVKDWASLQAALRGTEGTRDGDPTPVLDKLLADRHGYTGTALELLRAGVPQVVAMRYEVGDAYARRLARRFYRHLLADPANHPVDGALALARMGIFSHSRAAEHHAVDHATPLVLGARTLRFVPRGKKAAQAGKRDPKPQPLLSGSHELDRPHNFVGRGAELTRLRREWLESAERPVALIQGLAGLGKTSLMAETIHLWHDRFEHVLGFSARGAGLPVEGFLRGMDQKLAMCSPEYRQRCDENAMDAIFVPAGKHFDGESRYEKLTNNLVEVLRSSRVLFALDNFDSVLRPSAGPTGAYAAQDPAWDRLLATLADGLRGSPSRLIVTSRHRPAALARPECSWFALGPLPIGEAVLFFQGTEALRALIVSRDEADRRLAKRVLDVSRGHPLILQRLAAVARAERERSAEGWKGALAGVLDTIAGEGYRRLPDVFAGAVPEEKKEVERRYLEEVAIGAVDLLIGRLSADARTLLWVVTRAFEGVDEGMIERVWSGESVEDEQMREMAGVLEMLARLPEELRAQAPAVPDEIREAVDVWKARGVTRTERPPAGPLLAEMFAAGLLHRTQEHGLWGAHELVKEQAAAWMERHSEEQAGQTEQEVWIALGSRYGAMSKVLFGAGKPGSRQAALEVGRRGIRYLTTARAFDALGAFASGVVISTNDPSVLGPIIADLEAAAGEVPAGEARWRLRTYLADALDNAGRTDAALMLFEQAADEAEAAEHWSDLGWICANWAIALVMNGQLEQAKATHKRSAEAKQRAGSPRLGVLGSELEAFRIDVMTGKVAEALAEIETLLAEVRGYWQLHREGKEVPEAPGEEPLARTLIGALDIAEDAYRALQRWEDCLRVTSEIEELKKSRGESPHQIARTSFNKSGPLLRLNRLGEAKSVLERCLEVDREAGDVAGEAADLSSLAGVWSRLGDQNHAIALERQALTARDRLPDPNDRAISHSNLSKYLHEAGQIAEAADHWLAGLTYPLTTGIDPMPTLQMLAEHLQFSTARGQPFPIPRIADLLANPSFTPLRTWLAARNVPLDKLQAVIDNRVDQVRTALEQAPSAPTTPAPDDPTPTR